MQGHKGYFVAFWHEIQKKIAVVRIKQNFSAPRYVDAFPI